MWVLLLGMVRSTDYERIAIDQRELVILRDPKRRRCFIEEHMEHSGLGQEAAEAEGKYEQKPSWWLPWEKGARQA